MFQEFKDYMFSLLVEPLQKGKKIFNQFYIFFSVIGKLFDDCKKDLEFTREQSTIITCKEELLEIYGQERKMPRLQSETLENYRYRLLHKWDIAILAGTKQGILETVKLLGYPGTYIELMKYLEPTKFAEFIIFLRVGINTTITDLSIIDDEVWRIKETYALPNYGFDYGNKIVIKDESEVIFGEIRYPRCGAICSGIYPRGRRKSKK